MGAKIFISKFCQDPDLRIKLLFLILLRHISISYHEFGFFFKYKTNRSIHDEICIGLRPSGLILVSLDDTACDTDLAMFHSIFIKLCIYRVQYGCKIRIQIPVIDVDGDTVRCRWSTSTEAASISKLLPNAVLNEVKRQFHFI